MNFDTTTEDYNIFVVVMAFEEDKNNFFKFIHNYSDKQNKKQANVSNIPLYAEYLLNYANSNGFICRYCVEKDKMMFGFCKKGTFQLFLDEATKLEDIIEYISETNNIPMFPVSCNEKTLEQFINVIYPKSFEILKNNVK